jgi:molybdenum cofactor cytidylyltransferase
MTSGVVLAAGASTRMGTQKLLLPLGAEPLVRHVVRQVCEAGFDEVLVVAGYQHEQVLAALEGLPVRHALNPDYASGMGSSFRTAVEHLPGSDAAIFALADQPFVTANPASSGRGSARSRRRPTCSSASSSRSWPRWSTARGPCSSVTRTAWSSSTSPPTC